MARFEEHILMRILWRGGGRVAHLVYANLYKPEAIRTSNLTQSTHIFLFNIESSLGTKFLDNSADKLVFCSERLPRMLARGKGGKVKAAVNSQNLGCH